MKTPRTPPELLARARELRKNMTKAELLVWEEVRSWASQGLRIRRQHPISPFIVDFAYLPQKIVIEIDGQSHGQKEGYDSSRQGQLQSKGWTILRFDNEEVLRNPNAVARAIYQIIVEKNALDDDFARQDYANKHHKKNTSGGAVKTTPANESFNPQKELLSKSPSANLNRKSKLVPPPRGGVRGGATQAADDSNQDEAIEKVTLPLWEGDGKSQFENLQTLLNHPALQAIAQKTKNTPYENNLFLVGGAVRDALLSRQPKNDLDIVTELDAQALAKSLDKEPQIYPRFGTAMIRVAKTNIELVTARRESYDSTSRKPRTEPATLLDDAKRRDYTVNTLLLNIHTGELIDPLGTALSDLETRTLRTPLNPAETFHDDPLRMLRAVRFKHQLGFDYETETNFPPESKTLSERPSLPGRDRGWGSQKQPQNLAAALTQQSPRLAIISQERIRDEFTKILLGPNPDLALQELLDFGLLHHWAPELEALVGVTQGKWHYADVWIHTLHVVKNAAQTKSADHPSHSGEGQGWGARQVANPEFKNEAPPLPLGEGLREGPQAENPERNKLTLLLAALLHDIAKPLTRTIDSKGDIRFFDHENVGADLAYTLCLRWRYSQETATQVRLLVKNHMRLTGIKTLSLPATRRIIRDLDDQLENWLTLIDSDASALKKGVRKLDLSTVRTKIAEVKTVQPKSNWNSPLSGKEIMALAQLPPGPQIGRLKTQLENLVIEGQIPPDDKEKAKDALQSLLRNRP